MSRLIKKQTTHHIDAAGKRVPSGTPGARRVSVESRKWYAAGVPGWPKGKAVPLVADKRLAQKMLADLLAQAERGVAGVSPAKTGTLALDPLVDEFREAVARNAGEKHTTRAIQSVRRMLAGCKLRTVADLTATDLTARAETFVWGLVGELTPLTAAYVGKHARHFTRWLWRKKKVIDHDPLSGMDLPSQANGSKRRALSADELARTLDAARTSTLTFRGLTGLDRHALYAIAVTTGFRAEELSHLDAASLSLDADPPLVRLAGEFTKNGKDAVQPLSPATIGPLRELVARRPTGPLWPGTWFEKAAKMLRHDLLAANVAAKTAAGKADFHALRHTFTTILGRSAPLKVVQDLARHSTPILTVGRYSHADDAEKAAAIAAIPLGGEPAELTRRQLEITAGVLFALFAALFVPAVRTDTDTGEH